MANIHLLTTPIERDDGVEDQPEVASSENSNIENSPKTKKVPSKREIMEQLSRERFPWDD